GVDANRLLLGLGRVAYADHDRLRLVEQDLHEPDWPSALDLDRMPDAFVSTTALHWLHRPGLADLYTTIARMLRPGGVLVNGDNLYDRPVRPTLGDLCSHVGERRAERAGPPPRTEVGDETWSGWWEAALAAPELGDLVADRGTDAYQHSNDPEVSVDTHIDLLLRA